MRKNPLFLKRFGDTSLPFSKENAPNRRNLTFSKEIITFLKPELTQSRQSRWEIFGRLREPSGIRNGDGRRDRQGDRERQTRRQTRKQIGRQTGIQTRRLTGIQTGTDREPGRKTDSVTDRETDQETKVETIGDRQ